MQSYFTLGYERMFIMYAFWHAQADFLGSTGRMERRLIAQWKNSPGCENVAPGGEGAVEISPSLVYVAVRRDTTDARHLPPAKATGPIARARAAGPILLGPSPSWAR